MNYKKYDCILKVKNAKSKCKQTNCRHFLDSEQHLNCSIIAAEDGPMTLQEIGDFYGISRMRVCQIEKAILKKIKIAPGDLNEFD
jgi:DNA-directed RNA polymerase sigma subunit (sigma70/sigma32)